MSLEILQFFKDPLHNFKTYCYEWVKYQILGEYNEDQNSGLWIFFKWLASVSFGSDFPSTS